MTIWWYILHECHVLWVMFEGASCRCAQCTGPVMCEEDFSMNCFFRGRRNFWWCWRMIPRRIAVRLMCEVDCACFFFVADAMFGDIGGWLLLLRRCTWRFLCEKDEAWVSFLAAGATCGDNAGVPPAALRIALDVSGAELSTINYAFAEFLHRSDFWTAFLVVKAFACTEMCWNMYL